MEDTKSNVCTFDELDNLENGICIFCRHHSTKECTITKKKQRQRKRAITNRTIYLIVKP